MPLAVANFLQNIGATAGRAANSLAIEAGRLAYNTRDKATELFGVSDTNNIIFTQNATMALNTIFHGFLKPNDLVVTSDCEHNSTIRPLNFLKNSKNIKIILNKSDNDCIIDLDELQKNSKGAKLISIVHGNNVTGSVNDIKQIAKIAKDNGACLMIDAAQTAGVIDINIDELGVDFLACSGHKGLYGTHGTGLLLIGRNVDINLIEPLMQGGTGSASEIGEQPNFLPDKFEAGTQNCLGIASLNASLNWLKEFGVQNIYNHELKLRDALINGLKDCKNINLYYGKSKLTTGVVSVTINEMSVSELAYTLDNDYKILTRHGLHCASSVHRRIGTNPNGTVRLSIGAFNTIDEINYVVDTLKELGCKN